MFNQVPRSTVFPIPNYGSKLSAKRPGIVHFTLRRGLLMRRECWSTSATSCNYYEKLPCNVIIPMRFQCCLPDVPSSGLECDMFFVGGLNFYDG